MQREGYVANGVGEVKPKRNGRLVGGSAPRVESGHVRGDRGHVEDLAAQVVDSAEQDECEPVFVGVDGGEDVRGVQEPIGRSRLHLDEPRGGIAAVMTNL